MMGSPGREEGAPQAVSTRVAAGSAGPLSPSRPRSRRPRGWGAGRGRAGTLEPRVANKEGLPVSRVPARRAVGRVEESASGAWSGWADSSEKAGSAGALGRGWRLDGGAGERGSRSARPGGAAEETPRFLLTVPWSRGSEWLSG